MQDKKHNSKSFFPISLVSCRISCLPVHIGQAFLCTSLLVYVKALVQGQFPIARMKTPLSIRNRNGLSTRSEAEIPNDYDTQVLVQEETPLTTTGRKGHRIMNRYWGPHQLFPSSMCLLARGKNPTKNEGFCQ